MPRHKARFGFYSSWGSQNCLIHSDFHMGMSLTGTSFPPILNTLKNHPVLVLAGIELNHNTNLYFFVSLLFLETPITTNYTTKWHYGKGNPATQLAPTAMINNQTFCSLWYCFSAENGDPGKNKGNLWLENQTPGLAGETDAGRKQHCTKTSFFNVPEPLLWGEEQQQCSSWSKIYQNNPNFWRIKSLLL